MESFGIPKKCIHFLRTNEGKTIELNNSPAEIEKVIFYPIDELKEDYEIIDTNEYYLNYNEFKTDPEIQYHIPTINLIKKDAEDNYDNDGLLVWLPVLKCFGTFDIDHCIGYLFKDVEWTELERDLGNFINTQWNPEQSKCILF